MVTASITPLTNPFKLWVLWSAVAMGLLMAKPWGVFGWDEWLAVSAPLLLLYPPMRRIDVLVLGLIATGLAWFFLSDQSGGWLELAALVAVLVAGTNLAHGAVHHGSNTRLPGGEMERLSNEKLFFDALNRELSRVRREQGGSLAVLSLDVNGQPASASLGPVFEFLDAELRAYSDIAQIGDRIVALVPDVTEAQAKPLLKRLTDKWASTCEGELRIGLARFPQEAICASDLIELADRKRIVRGIAAAPAKELESATQDQVSA